MTEGEKLLEEDAEKELDTLFFWEGLFFAALMVAIILLACLAGCGGGTGALPFSNAPVQCTEAGSPGCQE